MNASQPEADFDLGHFQKKMSYNMVSEKEVEEFKSKVGKKKTQTSEFVDEEEIIYKTEELNRKEIQEYNRRLKEEERLKLEHKRMLKEKHDLVNNHNMKMINPIKDKSNFKEKITLVEQQKRRNKKI